MRSVLRPDILAAAAKGVKVSDGAGAVQRCAKVRKGSTAGMTTFVATGVANSQTAASTSAAARSTG
jgi:hypothetical protein